VRIIAGSAKGRRLFSPKGSRIRPTSDKVKEALFNILNGMIDSFSDCVVLDIFAGTGNLGIEALSRGAADAVFIDSHPDSVVLVKKNLALSGFSGRSRVVLREAVAALKSLGETDRTFQLVFIDPPYHQELLEKVLEFLANSHLLAENSLVVAEFSTKEKLGTSFGSLREIDRRTYGDTALAFFTLQLGGSPP
jgi:16S rRNA (guanine966-N2)-methyltransferase